jgi:hypothetical protein
MFAGDVAVTTTPEVAEHRSTNRVPLVTLEDMWNAFV